VLRSTPFILTCLRLNVREAVVNSDDNHNEDPSVVVPLEDLPDQLAAAPQKKKKQKRSQQK
jgi:hypothetical protein